LALLLQSYLGAGVTVLDVRDLGPKLPSEAAPAQCAVTLRAAGV
jgi:hypothetical protein